MIEFLSGLNGRTWEIPAVGPGRHIHRFLNKSLTARSMPARDYPQAADVLFALTKDLLNLQQSHPAMSGLIGS